MWSYLLFIVILTTILHYIYKIYLSFQCKSSPYLRNRLLQYIANIQIDNLFTIETGVSSQILEKRIKGYEKLKQHAQYIKQKIQGNKQETNHSATISDPLSHLSDARFGLSSCVPFYVASQVNRDLQYPMWVEWTNGVIVGHTKQIHDENENNNKEMDDMDINHPISYDLSGSFGVNVAGHNQYAKWLNSSFSSLSPDVCKSAVALGSVNAITCDNITKLQRVSGQECVSFHNSGTEAVMSAVRLARFNTGKPYVITFRGAYHGWWDPLLQGSTIQHNNIITLKDYNKHSLNYVSYEGLKIAAVIVNPMQAFAPNNYLPVDATLLNGNIRTPMNGISKESHGFIQQYTTFLQTLRQICNDMQICLIFDEVYSGFRISQFGAQQLFNVKADIVCYGKTLGGGLPIGVICGSSTYLRKCDERYLFRRADVYGTFAASPAVMSTMNHFLNWILDDNTSKLYDTKYTLFNTWCNALNQRLVENNLPLRLLMWNSLFSISFTSSSHYHWLFQYYLRKHGLYLSWTGTGRCLLTLDYDETMLQHVTQKFMNAANEMKDDGWWETAPTNDIKYMIGKQILYKSIVTPIQQFWDEIDMHKRIDDEVAHKHPVNQMFHVISSLITMTTYVMFIAGQGWWNLAVFLNLVSQAIRQSGHFFFERSPPGAERAKIGFDTMHKKILCGLGAILYIIASHNQCVCDFLSLGHHTEYLTIDFFVRWLVAFFIACFLSKAILVMNNCNIRLGILWTIKILTDPFTDVHIYGGSFKRVYYRYLAPLQKKIDMD